MAQKALGALSAWVVGQAAPGVPLWLLDRPSSSAHHIDVPLVVFPGNVGHEFSLADLVQGWSEPGAARPRLSQLLKDAEEGGYAIGAFNVYDITGGAAVIAAAEDARSPVIIQVISPERARPG